MPFYIYLYCLAVFLTGSLLLHIVYFLGNKIFNETFWYEAAEGDNKSAKIKPIRGMRYEIFNLFIAQAILLGCFSLFSFSIDSFTNTVIPNFLFIGGLAIGILFVLYHNLHKLPEECESKIEEISYERREKIRYGFWRKWVFTYFSYGLYATCSWLLTIYLGVVFLAYNLITSLSQINQLSISIRQQLYVLSTSKNSEIYVDLLQIIRNKYEILGDQIAEITVNYAFILGLITLFSIIVTCTRIKKIWGNDGIKWIQWAFFFIVIILGPATLILGTTYYGIHFKSVFPIIDRIIDLNMTKGASIVFPLESLREYFLSSFKPGAFFKDQIISFRAFSIWLIPLTSIIISRFLKSIFFPNYVSSLFPKPIADFLNKLIDFLSSFKPPSNEKT